jgi:hypothetical protein
MTPIPLCAPDGTCHAYLCPACGEVKGWGAKWQGRPFSPRESLETRARLNQAYAYLGAQDCQTHCHTWSHE